MNWKLIPDCPGTWLRIGLDEGVPAESQVHTINLWHDGSLVVGNHYTPHGPSMGYRGDPLNTFNQPHYRWVLLPTDESGALKE